MLHQATSHMRHRLFGAHLSPELMASHLVKTFPVRSGDTVRVMRGDHKGSEGKVTRIDKKKYRIYVEGLTREKVDGTQIFVPIHPSKVMVTQLNLDDKWRKKILERKKSWKPKPKEPIRKPKGKPAAKVEEPPKVTEIKSRAAEEKVAQVKSRAAEEKVTEIQKTEEEKPLLETKPLAEKTLAEEKLVRKKTAKTKKVTAKKATVQEMKVESKKPAKERTPKAEKKKTKRKTGKKTEGGA
jgi:large subunit ribosomal protein L24